jgi:ZIP family zinc transporter
MLETIAFAVIASAGLVAGSAIGAFWRAPRVLVASALAFAAGSLIAALAFELFAQEQHESLWVASVGLVAGGTVFIVVDAWLEHRWPAEKATGFALVAIVTLDGVPESLALGVTLAAQGSVALLAAIFIANLGEALGGAAELRQGGESPGRAIRPWVVTALLLMGAVITGRLVGANEGSHDFLLAFAGGAVLAAVADTLLPEAYRQAGPFVAFATVAGFLASFLLAASD